MNKFEQETLAFTKVTAAHAPDGLTQPVDQIPGAAGYSVRPSQVRLSARSPKKSPRNTQTILTYSLNVPFVDGLVTVSKLYKVISEMAFNYQGSHQDSFFEQYPELIIRSDAEMASGDQLSTSYLRRNYRLFSKRLAHYYYHYCEAKKLQLAALLNIAIVGKLNGNERVRELAENCKMTNINMNCNLYQRFPQPQGLEAYMLPLCAYATGADTMGNDLIALPQWRTEVFGNKLEHDIPLSTFYNAIGDKPKLLSATEIANDFPGATDLISNIFRTVKQFACRMSDSEMANSPYDGYQPCMDPPIENGSAETVSNGKASLVAPANYSEAKGFEKASQPASSKIDSSFTAKLWNNYFFITRYMEKAFPEMLAPNSDYVAFAMGSLKLVESSSDAGQVAWKVRSVPNTAITDIAKRLSYSDKGKMNTATIIKYTPMLYDDDKETRTSFYKSLLSFEDNFNRYPVDADNPVDIIKAAKKWPHINPTMFGSSLHERPLVVNATSSISREYATDDGSGHVNYPAPNFAGKFASFFDFARTCGVATDQTSLQMFGVTKEMAKGIIEAPTAESAVVFKEYPDTTFVLAQDPFDNSDIGQAGFNLLVSYNNPSPSDWDLFFTDPDYYRKALKVEQKTVPEVAASVEYADDSNTVIALAPAEPAYSVKDGSGSTSAVFARAHVINEDYLAKIKHAFIFVGVGVFNHPIIATALASSGYFVTREFSPSQTDLSEAITALKSYFDPKTDLAKQIYKLAVYATTFDNNAYKVGGSDSNLAVLNPFLAAIKLIRANGAEQSLVMDRFQFNPFYGPVQPALADSIFGARSQILPTKHDVNASDSPLESWDTIDSLPFGKASYGITQGQGADNMVKLPVIYDQFSTAMSNAFEELGAISAPSIDVDSKGVVSMKEEPFKVNFFSPAKAVLAMASDVSIQYAGVQHTLAFWSTQDKVRLNNYEKLSANGIMPEQNVLAEQRKPNAAGNNVRPNDYTKGIYNGTPQSAASLSSSSSETSATDSTLGGAGCGTKQSKYRNKHGRRGGSRKGSATYGKNTASDRSVIDRDGTAVSSAPLSDKVFDNSSASMDKEFDKVSKSKRGRLDDSVSTLLNS